MPATRSLLLSRLASKLGCQFYLCGFRLDQKVDFSRKFPVKFQFFVFSPAEKSTFFLTRINFSRCGFISAAHQYKHNDKCHYSIFQKTRHTTHQHKHQICILTFGCSCQPRKIKRKVNIFFGANLASRKPH